MAEQKTVLKIGRSYNALSKQLQERIIEDRVNHLGESLRLQGRGYHSS